MRRIKPLIVTLVMTGALAGGGAAIANAASSTSSTTTSTTGTTSSSQHAPVQGPPRSGTTHHCPGM